MAHLWEEMSPHPAASFTSARGLESWAGSSAVTAIAKKAFGMCEGAAAADAEKWREGPSTSWYPANVPRVRPSHPMWSQMQQKASALTARSEGTSSPGALVLSLSFPFGVHACNS